MAHHSPYIRPRIRIDNLLNEKDFANSRSRARDMISRGCVKVDGVLVKKSGVLVDIDCKIEIEDPARNYVSRAALKLIAGLEAAQLEPSGKYCVDLGASTGGFTQVLLEKGATHVTAVDVGHGQLVSHLKAHQRVTSLEGMNARALTIDDFLRPPQIVVSDMSFVSLTIAAEPALLLTTNNAHAVLLVKPQFEVGKDGIGKGGLVKNDTLAQQAVSRVKDWFNNLHGWQVTKLLESPVTGGDGNKEYLLCGARHG